ncbi:MAG TPA: hypothetical protein VE988_05245 [Gemmataceae bacterium]|nr:hypothetical protein [Gemmataceae bacterium]
MLMRKLLLGCVVVIAASVAGCKCCGSNSCSNCPPPVKAFAPAPCNNCGPTGAPGVVVPPPPGVVAPGPGGGPYGPGPYGGTGYERKL